MITGISNGRMYSIKTKVERLYNVADVRDHGNNNHSDTILRSTKGLEAQNWMEDFAKDSADRHAHVRELHLARMYSKLDIYNLYFTRKTLTEDSMSYGAFLRMWLHDFPHVKSVKVISCRLVEQAIV